MKIRTRMIAASIMGALALTVGISAPAFATTKSESHNFTSTDGNASATITLVWSTSSTYHLAYVEHDLKADGNGPYINYNIQTVGSGNFGYISPCTSGAGDNCADQVPSDSSVGVKYVEVRLCNGHQPDWASHCSAWYDFNNLYYTAY